MGGVQMEAQFSLFYPKSRGIIPNPVVLSQNLVVLSAKNWGCDSRPIRRRQRGTPQQTPTTREPSAVPSQRTRWPGNPRERMYGHPYGFRGRPPSLAHPSTGAADADWGGGGERREAITPWRPGPTGVVTYPRRF